MGNPIYHSQFIIFFSDIAEEQSIFYLNFSGKLRKKINSQAKLSLLSRYIDVEIGFLVAVHQSYLKHRPASLIGASTQLSMLGGWRSKFISFYR
jgi:hypothetical protein